MSKIIYIMGCGRSGTTLFNIILENNTDCCAVGELADHARFSGKPNGFDPSTANYKFWENVEKELQKRLAVNYEELNQLIKKIESHYLFFFNFFHLVPKQTNERYYQYLRAFYDAIFQVSKKNILIDSSKYPGRALFLSRHFKDEVYFVYIVRNPIGVVESFSQKNINQKSKGFWASLVYYFVINFFCSIVRWITTPSHFIQVRFEDLVAQPEEELLRIQKKFGIDLSQSIDSIAYKKPLRTGYIFNGNRMRLKENIIVNKKTITHPKSLKNNLILALNTAWYRK